MLTGDGVYEGPSSCECLKQTLLVMSSAYKASILSRT